MTVDSWWLTVYDNRLSIADCQLSSTLGDAVMGLIERFICDRRMAKIDASNLPQHIAIIMDGNGRWAKKRRLPRSAGHRAGAETLKNIVDFCRKIGIRYLTVYAFSTENWKRPKDEVDTLMQLLREYLRRIREEIDGTNVKVRVLGDISVLPSDIQNEIIEVERKSSSKNGLNFNIAINYGGRREIITAVKRIIKETEEGLVDAVNIDEELFSARLYTSGMPDPDLLIRPSGEKRISNFLLWQMAYSEFWFSNIYWPDFKERHLLKAIAEYQKRDRRFGGI